MNKVSSHSNISITMYIWHFMNESAELTTQVEQKYKSKSLWLLAGKRRIGFIEDTTLQK